LQSCVTPAEAIDTGTAGGRLVFHIFGSIAEFERAIVRERTKAGVIAAKARVVLAVDRRSWPASEPNMPTICWMPAQCYRPLPGPWGSAGQPFIARWSGLPKQRNKDLMQGPWTVSWLLSVTAKINGLQPGFNLISYEPIHW
jgi:hypothetical protein